MRKYIFFYRIYQNGIYEHMWQKFHSQFEDGSREQSLRFGGGILKLLPLQGARRADMNTQGECPGLGASALSGREEGWIFLRIFSRYNLALSEKKCNFVGDI